MSTGKLDMGDNEWALELDWICADHRLSRLSGLTGDELTTLVSALEIFERAIFP